MNEEISLKLRKVGYSGAINLESLIEACGDGFAGLERHNKYEWQACDSSGPDGQLANDLNVPTGSTPSEAVALLWLALNEKK